MISQTAGFIIFRILIPALLLFLQYRLYRKTMAWLHRDFPISVWAHRAAIILFALFNAILIGVVILRPKLMGLPDWLVSTLSYPFFIWHGATLFIGLVLFISWVLKLPFLAGVKISRLNNSVNSQIENLNASPGFQSFDASRRTFLKRGVYGLSAASFAGSSYGVLLGKSAHDITSAEFIIPGLAPQLEGFTIGLMSDIHSSAFMTKEEMDRYVGLMNALKTDMIVVPGDFVNSLVEEVYPFAEAFSNLKAPHGVYGVMGNHDFFTRNPEVVAREVNDCGVQLLRNDKVIIEKNGGQFALLGVDDVGRPERALEKIETAMGNTAEHIPKILLCHRPYFLEQASLSGIDLVLSGHTHGGQVSLGQFGNAFITPASLASRYVWGTYSFGKTRMYVSRGIGTVGLPIRLNCPPEITRISLRSGV